MGSVVRGLAAGLIVLLLVCVAAVYFVNPSFDFDYAPLREVLVLAFVALPSVIIAFISARAYMKYGSVVLLLLGCGVVVFGATQVATVFLTGSSYTNISASVFYIGSIVAGVLHLVGSVALTLGKNPTLMKRRVISIVAAYAGLLLLISFVVVVAVQGISPVFMTGTGSTSLSVWSRIMLLIFFAIPSALFMLQYRRSGSTILYWYSLALALVAINAILLMFSAPSDSLLAWLGRIVTYVSGVYFIASVVSSRKIND